MKEDYFFCFGCHKEGNQVQYIQDFEFLTQEEALYFLAEIYRIVLPNNPFQNDSRILRYREALCSTAFQNFLRRSYDNAISCDPSAYDVYQKIFSLISRSKNCVWDDNFCYKEKTKKYQYPY